MSTRRILAGACALALALPAAAAARPAVGPFTAAHGNAGVTYGGRNRAFANGNAQQCTNVSC